MMAMVIDLSKALVCLFCALLLFVFPALSYSFVHEDEDDDGKIDDNTTF